jgi:antitoxin (DNA-binding transcriptional repressor) of toxin-antitoxin stability system
MRTISPLDLRRGLGQILDAASGGERFLIERDHKPLAMLVSIDDGSRLDEPADERGRRRLAALDRLEALSERLRAAHSSELSAVDAVRADRSRDDPPDLPDLQDLQDLQDTPGEPGPPHG